MFKTLLLISILKYFYSLCTPNNRRHSKDAAFIYIKKLQSEDAGTTYKGLVLNFFMIGNSNLPFYSFKTFLSCISSATKDISFFQMHYTNFSENER